MLDLPLVDGIEAVALCCCQWTIDGRLPSLRHLSILITVYYRSRPLLFRS